MSKLWYYCVMYSVDTNNGRYDCTHTVRIDGQIDSEKMLMQLSEALKERVSGLGKIKTLRLTNWILLKTEEVNEDAGAKENES